jgi:hypothetical protein
MNSSQSNSASLRAVSIAPRDVAAMEGDGMARDVPDAGTPYVYSLTVLVQQLPTGELTARAANLEVADVRAASIRGALSQMVAGSKSFIAHRLAQGAPIPWIDPPLVATEKESQFLVPLHL